MEAQQQVREILDSEVFAFHYYSEEAQAKLVADLLAVFQGEPDEHQLDRGFGDCPHCRSATVIHCHECPADIFRDVAAAEGWRMDHIMGYGCIGLCPKCR